MSTLEEAQLLEKPWQLQGEVLGRTRPVNSLLENELQFDQATKLAPTLTEESQASIDEIILARCVRTYARGLTARGREKRTATTAVPR